MAETPALQHFLRPWSFDPPPTSHRLLYTMKLKARPVGITAEARAEHVQGRQFKAINVFLIIVMAAGSVGYGLSASIISTTL